MQKNSEAINLTWIKSHPSWRHFLDEEVDPRTSIGNSIADYAADQGHTVQGVAHIQTAFNFLASKQEAYEGLVRRLQRLAIALLRADATLRSEKGVQPQGCNAPTTCIDYPTIRLRPDFTEGYALEFATFPPDILSSNHELTIFWRLTHWRTLVEPADQPTTWLDFLYIIDILAGASRTRGKSTQREPL